MENIPSLQQVLESINTNYSPLSAECQAELIKVAKTLFCDKNQLLVKEGEFSDKTYFIISGCARAYYLKDGKDITDWFAFENDFISSIKSFFQFIPSPHFIETLESCVLLEISREDIFVLMDKFHDFERLARTIVTKTMLQLQERIVAVQFETASQKYENLINYRPEIVQRVPLTHIASYLGITLETLSRIRNPKNRI